MRFNVQIEVSGLSRISNMQSKVQVRLSSFFDFLGDRHWHSSPPPRIIVLNLKCNDAGRMWNTYDDCVVIMLTLRNGRDGSPVAPRKCSKVPEKAKVRACGGMGIDKVLVSWFEL